MREELKARRRCRVVLREGLLLLTTTLSLFEEHAVYIVKQKQSVFINLRSMNNRIITTLSRWCVSLVFIHTKLPSEKRSRASSVTNDVRVTVTGDGGEEKRRE